MGLCVCMCMQVCMCLCVCQRVLHICHLLMMFDLEARPLVMIGMSLLVCTNCMMKRIHTMPEVAITLAELGMRAMSGGRTASAKWSNLEPSCCDMQLQIYNNNIEVIRCGADKNYQSITSQLMMEKKYNKMYHFKIHRLNINVPNC